MPKVSVIIPLYNCASYIGKAVESILAQTYADWELLICDDGSTDGSQEIARQYAAKEPRIRLLQNERNLGNVATYNRLFFAAQGDYIMVQDADDWSSAERIERQVASLEETGAGICITSSVNYDEQGLVDPNPVIGSKKLGSDLSESIGWPATMMFRRSVLQDIPGFHTYFNGLPAFDWYFVYLTVIRHGGFYLDERLYHVLLRNNSNHRHIDYTDKSQLRKLVVHDVYLELKRQLKDTGTDWLQQGREDLASDFEARLISDRKLLSERLRVFACYSAERKSGQALPAIKKALRLNPWGITNYRTLLYLLRSQNGMSRLKR